MCDGFSVIQTIQKLSSFRLQMYEFRHKMCIFEVVLNEIPLNSHIVCSTDKAPHFINDVNEWMKEEEEEGITIIKDHKNT